MVAVLKSLDVSSRRHHPKRDEFRDPEVGFFLYGDAAAFVGNNRPAASDGRNRTGRRLTDYGTFDLDAGLEDQDCNLFWLIGSFVNLLSRQKDASADRIPNVQFIAAQLSRPTQIRTRRVDTGAGAGLPASPITF
ncbi:hypothetical protein [Rhizobium leguminosarum]|uniref:hypothetical protein n=1 Tax=Rhizobium leguminosarum TaxID=384 RepID=UPI0012FCF7FE|nr:hypothetical protein [Rhizobium leguminosarum]MBY2925617.1 hypothetical protein [Rhizobium leguminosarum]MBY2962492.1 hypothetical protein [Rhizobium leguminosarum]MBY2984600.1 hypothetical protein [Rhizobium leguminosarum]MBY3024354.1 hypothetical protein [Rhizobium leguminosarum]